MRILGIDPGFDRTGWGVVDVVKNDFHWVGHGCIQTSPKDTFVKRLQETRDGVERIIKKAKPDVVVVEQLFFSNNAKTAINVGMGRGVIMLAIADSGTPIIELTPNQVKQATAGYGGAKKEQIQEMVKRLLKLKEIPKPDDAADALAIAIAGSTMRF
ncbi:MAG: crossover junction endodeoxyribonuclease RuvC [Patescibacteria group bacterium]